VQGLTKGLPDASGGILVARLWIQEWQRGDIGGGKGWVNGWVGGLTRRIRTLWFRCWGLIFNVHGAVCLKIGVTYRYLALLTVMKRYFLRFDC
jgi:hypothetical protein